MRTKLDTSELELHHLSLTVPSGACNTIIKINKKYFCDHNLAIHHHAPNLIISLLYFFGESKIESKK